VKGACGYRWVAPTELQFGRVGVTRDDDAAVGELTDSARILPGRELRIGGGADVEALPYGPAEAVELPVRDPTEVPSRDVPAEKKCTATQFIYTEL
jgi:hypothetical protein